MKIVSKKEIIKGLKFIGLSRGDNVIVHSSLASFGKIQGGADTVIDALLEVVGNEGTVLMPSFDSTDKIFDIHKSNTTFGAVPTAFWKRKNALRSRHPLASVAAIGAKAEWFIENHENADTAHCENTPYKKLAEIGGKILLLGVDQDRNTFLHTPESIARLQYLRPANGSYVDTSGKVREKTWPYFPGPHRNFIGLQSWFESSGLVKKVLIGSCVAQVMPAAKALQMLLERLKHEPALFISKNPNMNDAIWQNADIFRAMFKKERFTLVADSQYCGQYIEECVDNLKRFGIDNIVLSCVNNTPWDRINSKTRKWYLAGLKNAEIDVKAIKIATPAAEPVITLLNESGAKVVIAPSVSPSSEIAKIASAGFQVHIENVYISGIDCVKMIDHMSKKRSNIKIAFNPLGFAQLSENPFLTTYSKTNIKRIIGSLYLNDGLATGERTVLEEGLGEIKELISILRSRSFDGMFILQGPNITSFGKTAMKFIEMLQELGTYPECSI